MSILAIVGGGPGRNVLARPGTEHLHVLPVDEDQVVEWIDDGSVERRRVLLMDTKGRQHAYGALARDARVGLSVLSRPRVEQAPLLMNPLFPTKPNEAMASPLLPSQATSGILAAFTMPA